MRNQPRESFGKALRDYAGAVVVAVGIALLIRSFVIETYRIPSTSMVPTLLPGDTIFVSKWRRYDAESGLPRLGDVVVYAPPSEPSQSYIKRVIGLPGDRIEIRRGRLILNSNQVGHASGDKELCGEERLDGRRFEICWHPPLLGDVPAQEIPEGHVYVLGDLRSKQTGHGMVPVSSIKGRVLWVWLSIEPSGASASWFSRIRFERMFTAVQ